MVAGQIGQSGRVAVCHVEEELIHTLELALFQHQTMVVRTAMELHLNQESVEKLNAQLVNFLFKFFLNDNSNTFCQSYLFRSAHKLLLCSRSANCRNVVDILLPHLVI